MVMNPYGLQLNNTEGAQEDKLFRKMQKKNINDENNDNGGQNVFFDEASYNNGNNNISQAASPSNPNPNVAKGATYNELGGYNEMAKRNAANSKNLNEYARYNDARNKSLRMGQARQNVQKATNEQAIAETGLSADYANKAKEQGNKDYGNPNELENFDAEFDKFVPPQLDEYNFKSDPYDDSYYKDYLDRYAREISPQGLPNSSFLNGTNPLNMPSEQTNLNKSLEDEKKSLEDRMKYEEDRINKLNESYDQLLKEYEKRGKSFNEAQKLATDRLSKEYEDRIKGLDDLQKFKKALESNTISEAEAKSGNLNEMLSSLDEADTIKALSALGGPGYNAGRLGLIDSILERESMGQAIKDARGINDESQIAQSKKAGALSSYAKSLEESKKSSDKKRQEMEKRIGDLLEKNRNKLEENFRKGGEDIQKSVKEGQKSLSDRKNRYGEVIDQYNDPKRRKALADEQKNRDALSRKIYQKRTADEAEKGWNNIDSWEPWSRDFRR